MEDNNGHLEETPQFTHVFQHCQCNEVLKWLAMLMQTAKSMEYTCSNTFAKSLIPDVH